MTPPCRRALVQAEKHALSLGSDGIGTEHLLLGLLDEHTSAAVAVLGALGLS